MNTNNTSSSSDPITTNTQPETVSRLHTNEPPRGETSPHNVNGTGTAPPEITHPAKHQSLFSPEQLARIATQQKLLILLVVCLVPVAYLPIPTGIESWIYLACLGLHITGIILTCKLARAMHRKVWPYAVGSAIPIVNLACFSHITIEAAVILRLNGIRVGFLGVSRREMQNYGCPKTHSPTETWVSPLNRDDANQNPQPPKFSAK